MRAISNTDEQEFWSGPSGLSWITHESAQDYLLSEVLDLVLDRARIEPRARILDIGCGTGALSTVAAEAAGIHGRVLATDISEPMLKRAEQRLASFRQADTLLADAQSVVWPETAFNTAVSRFGVMFFGNPPEAFANIARALRKGGRMVFAAWGPPSRNPYWREVPRVAVERLDRPPSVPPHTPGPMGLSDRDWSIAQLEAAGLQDVACEAVSIHLPVRGTPEDAADLALAIGPAARVVRMFGAAKDDIASIREGIAEVVRPFSGPDDVRIPALVYIYTARTG